MEKKRERQLRTDCRQMPKLSTMDKDCEQGQPKIEQHDDLNVGRVS